MVSSDGNTAMSMSLNCTPKNGKNGKFCYVYFATIKKLSYITLKYL